MDSEDTPRLVTWAVVVEGLLAAGALLLGWFLLDDPLPMPLLPTGSDVPWLLGSCAALTGAALWVTSDAARGVGWMRRLNDTVADVLGPIIARESTLGLLLVSLAAGLGEELLFRGALLPLLGLWGSSLVFGLCHAVSPAYFALAAVMGLILGWLAQQTGGLFVPIAGHAVYDAVALLRMRPRCREAVAQAERDVAAAAEAVRRIEAERAEIARVAAEAAADSAALEAAASGDAPAADGAASTISPDPGPSPVAEDAPDREEP
jgi:hypothetical protein